MTGFTWPQSASRPSDSSSRTWAGCVPELSGCQLQLSGPLCPQSLEQSWEDPTRWAGNDRGGKETFACRLGAFPRCET